MQAEMKTVNLKGRDYEQGYFLDVDGTLCNYEGVIPESAKQAIKQALGAEKTKKRFSETWG